MGRERTFRKHVASQWRDTIKSSLVSANLRSTKSPRPKHGLIGGMEPNYDISGRKSAGRAKSPTGMGANKRVGARRISVGATGRRSPIANQAARAEQITA